MNNWIDEIETQITGRIDKELLAKDWTWMNVGGKPIFSFFPANTQDLRIFLKHCEKSFRVFGAGSNIVIRDNGFDGVFIRLLKGFRNIEFDDDRIIVDAGIPGNFLVQKALENNLGGIAFLATIPGQIGGFIKMNAGAHEKQTSEIIDWVEFMDSHGLIHRINANECKFGYRKSGFRHDDIILRTCVRTQKIDAKIEAQEIEKLMQYRQATQPNSGKMAGCFFKNHVNANTQIKAWQLIRTADVENFENIFVSDIHANFIMQTGDANAFEIEYFMEKLRANIFFNQKIWLHSEIEIIGA